jgi:DNA helicase-4
LIKQRNEAFVTRELEAHRAFFDSVEKTPLTDEQRRAAVVFEDRNLLVAAAGSGKSSTLVGKAGYAIQRGLFKPAEIIALAFNRDAAAELNERINKRIKPWLNGQVVKAHTFHGLGASIVRQVARSQGRKARIANVREEKPRLQAVLNECLESASFLSDWVLFLSLCREPIPSDDAFDSIEDYERYVDQQRKAKRNGEPAAFQALTGDMVNSAEELAIANWLYLNGVRFEYEKPFTPLPDAWDKYQPDFYYPDIDVWHEHFALDVRGRAPAHFHNYAVNADFKRKWLSEHAKDRWFETQSHQHRDGTIFERLEVSLSGFGQPFRTRTNAEVLDRVQQLGQTDTLDLLLQVLHLVKGNGVSASAFERALASLHDRQRGEYFARVFWPLFDAYNRRLRQEGKIDFDDMIAQAAEGLEDGSFSSPYRLILVDEFQDLSPGRARLVKALLAQHEDTVLFGVGDDWQAINGFAGSDLRLFMDFENVFGPTHEGALTKTFRCAQGIADVGAFFVQRNVQGQKAKQVISEPDKTIEGLVELVNVAGDEQVSKELERQLSDIVAAHVTRRLARPDSRNATVFLLSRYGLQKTSGITPGWLDAMKLRYHGILDIEFMTMHRSKGLEADYVILLGLNAGWGLTFPSLLTNDPLVDMLLTNQDPFLHAEERRLFYVALTRAKKKATILFRQFNPSPFVLELMEARYWGRVTLRGAELPERCDRCGKGFMVQRTGPHGPFMGCTRYSSSEKGCRNRRTIMHRR